MNKVMFFHIIFYNETARAVRQGRFFWLTLPKTPKNKQPLPPTPGSICPPIKKNSHPIRAIRIKKIPPTKLPSPQQNTPHPIKIKNSHPIRAIRIKKIPPIKLPSPQQNTPPSQKISIICLICGLFFAQFALKSQHLCKKISIGFPVCKFCITFAPAFMPRWRNR